MPIYWNARYEHADVMLEFRVHRQPSKERCERMAVMSPANPFMTAAYLNARMALGGEAYILSLEEGDRMEAACPAVLRSGYLTRSLEIISLPLLPRSFSRQWFLATM